METSARRDLPARWIVATLLIAAVLPITQTLLVAPALPAIRDTFAHNSGSQFLARLVLVAPGVAIIFTSFLVGYVADQIRTKTILVAGLVGYSFLGLAAFFAHSLPMLVIVRIGIGVAVAAIMTAVPLLIVASASGPAQARLFGWQASVVSAAGAVAPVLGGALASLDWRYIFLVSSIAVLLIPSALALPDSRSVGTDHGNKKAGSTQQVAVVVGLAFAGTLVIYLMVTQLAFHLGEVGNASPLHIGVLLAVPALASALSSAQYGRWRERYSFAQLATAGFALMCIGYMIIAQADTNWAISAGLMIAGLGFGFHVPNCRAWLVHCASSDARGRSIGLLTTAIYAAQFASSFVSEVLVFVSSSRGSFLIGAMCAGLIAVATLLFGRDHDERSRLRGVGT